MSKRRGRGEGTIYRRGDGLWCAQITIGRDAEGKQLRKTVYGTSKAEVTAKVHELRQKFMDGELDQPTMPFSTFVDFWYGSIKYQVDERVYEDITRTCRLHLIPFLGHLQIAKFASWHVLQLYRDLEAAGRGSSVIRRSGRLLRRILQKAVKLGMLRENPAREEKLPKHHPPEIHPLTEEQVGVLLSATRGDRMEAFYTLAVDSGMRLGELLALTWGDVAFEEGWVGVTKSLSESKDYKLRVKECKTRHSKRRILLCKHTLDLLWTLRECNKYDACFVTVHGNYWQRTKLHKFSFKPLLQRANLPDIRFHDLRHTTATLLLARGVNPKVVQERLGHYSIEVTLGTYGHVLPTMQEVVVGVMGEVLTPRSSGTAVAAGSGSSEVSHG